MRYPDTHIAWTACNSRSAMRLRVAGRAGVSSASTSAPFRRPSRSCHTALRIHKCESKASRLQALTRYWQIKQVQTKDLVSHEDGHVVQTPLKEVVLEQWQPHPRPQLQHLRHLSIKGCPTRMLRATNMLHLKLRNGQPKRPGVGLRSLHVLGPRPPLAGIFSQLCRGSGTWASIQNKQAWKNWKYMLKHTDSQSHRGMIGLKPRYVLLSTSCLAKYSKQARTKTSVPWSCSGFLRNFIMIMFPMASHQSKSAASLTHVDACRLLAFPSKCAHADDVPDIAMPLQQRLRSKPLSECRNQDRQQTSKNLNAARSRHSRVHEQSRGGWLLDDVANPKGKKHVPKFTLPVLQYNNTQDHESQKTTSRVRTNLHDINE